MRRNLRSRCLAAGVAWSVFTLPAYAVDGTWTGASSDEWTDPTNWTSNPSVPDGTATFTNSGGTTAANNGGVVSIGAIQFTGAPTNAQAYTINVNDFFIVNGTGIFNNSTNTQTFNVAASLIFQGSSTANGGSGTVNIVNSGFIYFQDTSTVGTANITNNGILQFSNNSNAGSGSLTNSIETDFFDSSRAGTAMIVNNGTLTFNNTASGDHATVTGTGSVQFNNDSNAGNASFDLHSGLLSFSNNASAGNATIGSTNVLFPMGIDFHDTSTAGNATIRVIATTGAGLGVMNFYDSSNAGTAHITNDKGLDTGGITQFHDTSTASSATIVNQNGGATQFNDTSTAASASITNSTGSGLAFFDTTTAGSATIVNNGGSTTFYVDSTGGTATLTNNSGGQLFFSGLFGGNGNADASGMRVVNNTGGQVDISGAVSNVSIGSIEGAGQVLLGSKSLTLGATNLSTTISGVISDGGTSGGVGGSLIKVGTGTLTLTAANTYTGATTVNAGTLVVNGSLASAVTLNGGILGGNGTIGGLTVASGGTIAPGNSIGTMNVAGNVSFAPGSFYNVEANAAGQSDKIIATGTATLTGGTVQVQAQSGSYGQTTTYTILTASDGRTGTFSGVTSNFAFLVPSLSYSGTSVLLTLTLGTSGPTTPGAVFTNVGVTRNQRAVGNGLDASAVGSALVQSIIPLTVSQALQAYDALSGEIHASTQTVLSGDAGFLRQAVLGRLRSAAYDGGGTAALGLGGPLSYAAAPQARASFASVEPLAKPLTFWAQGFGSWGSVDSDGNAARLTRNTGGAFTGLDIGATPQSRLGIAAGYSQANINVSDRNSSATVDTGHVAAYGGTAFGAWKLRGGASYGWSTIDTKRTVSFVGLTEQDNTRYQAGTAQVFGEIGYGLAAGQVAYEPFAGLAWQNIRTQGFSESGAIAALNGSANNFNVGYSSLGLRAATAYALSNGMTLIPRAAAAWQHAFNSVTPTAALSFASTGAGFTVAGVPLARDSALVDAGLDLQLTPRALLGLSFIGQFAAGSRDAGIKGKFTLALQ